MPGFSMVELDKNSYVGITAGNRFVYIKQRDSNEYPFYITTATGDMFDTVSRRGQRIKGFSSYNDVVFAITKKELDEIRNLYPDECLSDEELLRRKIDSLKEERFKNFIKKNRKKVGKFLIYVTLFIFGVSMLYC